MTGSLISHADLLVLAEIAWRTPPGAFLELGVYKGGSAVLLAEICREQKRRLHLFDTFTGIPERSDIDFHQVGDFGDTSLEAVQALVPEADFHVGLFPDTLPPDLCGVAFAHVDCDQYASVSAACRLLPSRMVRHGIIYFDDYGVLDGATAAVMDSLPGHAVLPNGKAIYVVN